MIQKLVPREDGKLRMIDLINRLNEMIEVINNLDHEVEALGSIVLDKPDTKDYDS